MHRQACRANGLEAALHHPINFLRVGADDDGVVHVDSAVPRRKFWQGATVNDKPVLLLAGAVLQDVAM